MSKKSRLTRTRTVITNPDKMVRAYGHITQMGTVVVPRCPFCASLHQFPLDVRVNGNTIRRECELGSASFVINAHPPASTTEISK